MRKLILRVGRARGPGGGRKILGVYYVPPLSAAEKEAIARTYGISKKRIRSTRELIPQWTREGQRILNALARRDRVKPPKLDISINAGVWVDGLSPGFYRRAKRKGQEHLVALDTSLVAMGKISPGPCPPHLNTLLHEYRHHWQYEKLGKNAVESTYMEEGSVDWDDHELEKDAEHFARRECRHLRW
jgi:hypothetical protein